MPATALNNSMVRCGEAPMPEDAYLNLPGLALASLTNSPTFAAGSAGVTHRMFGIVA
jgi:hypothetical protein